jgi:DNA-binding LacI/PurR family transcriptional regulator
MAIAAMEVAQERGMAVPGDLAVLGSDDIEIAAYARPALSTVHVAWLEMTRVASQLLLEVIRTPELAEVKVRFETRLVIRESCGALARADAEGQGSRRERRSNRRA